MKKCFASLTFVLIAVLAFASLAAAQEDASETKSTVDRSIEKLDDALDSLIDTDVEIEQLSSGHKWTEGPVWNKQQKMLLFCDIPNNEINRFDAASKEVSVYMKPSGYDGIENEFGKEPGTNGLIYGLDGRLIACDHGNRRLYRLYEDGSKSTLIDRFEGKRFNSPNDLVMDKEGNIFFTDPPYGMLDESVREIEWHGVYRLATSGVVTLLTKEFSRPNGIGLSPDQKTLYVAQSDKKAPIYKSFPLNEDGTIGEGKLLYDAAPLTKDPGMPDGMAIDTNGNLWATGPGGVLIISPEGKLLGRILMGQKTANCAFGDDGSTLYITSSGYVCRVKTKAKGLGFDK